MQKEENNEITALTARIQALKLQTKLLRRQVSRHKPSSNNSRVKDTNGNRIDIGDKVKFLTKGLFESREGIVTKITKSRVTSTDARGVKIVRSGKNLKVLKCPAKTKTLNHPPKPPLRLN